MTNYCSYNYTRSIYDLDVKTYFCKIIGVSGDFVILENMDTKKFVKIEYEKLTPRTRKEVIEHFRKKKNK